MIKILDDTKTLQTLANDNTNGLGQLETINALVTKELNGIYEADIEILATDKHFKDVNVGSILKMVVNEAGDEQMFRVYNITKPMNEKVTLHCQHITYDLNKVPVKPFSATGAVATKNGMLNNIVGTYPFTMTTNINNTTSKFTLSIPKSFRECLGGYEGSILDTFRCEYDWDNLEVKMLSRLGNDNNVRIAYGKNLTDFNQEENIDNVYTSVMGYAVIDDVTYTGDVYHKVQATYPKVLIVDFSSDYEMGDTPTTAQLTAKAQQYATNNDIEVPNVNLSIAFVPLYQTEEYKNIAPLERVSLGDTVHVYFEKLDVEASARVTKTVWDVNLGRYHSIELGNAKANLNTVLNEVKKEAIDSTKTSTNFVETQLNDMATLIINGLGLHRTYVPVESGGYRMYLHNKENLADSDTQYVLSANGFLVSTDYGQTWNAGFDSQGNAVLNSLATITLKALEIESSHIKGGTIVFGSSSTMTMRTNDNNTGVIFEGDGAASSAEFVTKYRFNVLNNSYIDSTKTFNSYEMDYGEVNIKNYNPTNSYKMGNAISLTGSSSDNFTRIDVYEISNDNNDASNIYMSSSNDGNLMELSVCDSNDNTTASITMLYNKATNRSSIYLRADDIYANGNNIG